MKEIFAILVTYNPVLTELDYLISRLERQVQCIVICNNSDDSIEMDRDKIKVFNLNENIGIARAQTIGMEWAFHNGADFILQIDQDSIPAENMVEKLYAAYISVTDKGYRVGLVGPQDYDKTTGEVGSARLKKVEPILNTQCVSVDATLSSGSLIPKAVFNEVGTMMGGLFIDIVDYEYCWRLRDKGYIVLRNNEATLAHRLGEGRKKIFGLFIVGVPSPFRHYYAVRNTIYLIRYSYPPLYWRLTAVPKILFMIIVYPFFLDRGFIRFKFMLKGLYHGLVGRLGRLQE